MNPRDSYLSGYKKSTHFSAAYPGGEMTYSHSTRWTVTLFFGKLHSEKEALCEAIRHRTHRIRAAGHSFATQELLWPLQLLPGFPRQTEIALLGQSGPPAAIADGPHLAGAIPITLRINGKEHSLRIDPRTTLLDCIRETVELTGTKKGCDHGQCGACTIHVNGRRVLPASASHWRTMERDHHSRGSRHARGVHPMQAAFLACDAYQCGYCTSGQIMSAVALLKEPCGPRRRCREGTHERQHLPLRCLRQYRGSNPASSTTRS